MTVSGLARPADRLRYAIAAIIRLYGCRSTITVIPGPGNLNLQDYPTSSFLHSGGLLDTPSLSVLFQGLAPGLAGVERSIS